MRDILIREQKYIQIHPIAPQDKGPKLRSRICSSSWGRIRATMLPLSASQPGVLSNPARGKWSRARPHSIQVSIYHISNTIKDQSWVRRPTKPLPHNLREPGSRNYCAFHKGRGHPTVDCRTLDVIFRTWSTKDISKSSSSTPDYPQRLEWRGNPLHYFEEWIESLKITHNTIIYINCTFFSTR